MSIELQNLDANCNNCKHLKRDIAKYNSFNAMHGLEINASHRVQYGRCAKFNKDVSFLPNTCQIDTQTCFENRKALKA